MSNHCVLQVGGIEFDWGDYIPPWAMFLFREADFYCDPTILPNDDEWYEEIGHRSSAAECLDTLDKSSFDIDFFAAFYDELHSDIERVVSDAIKRSDSDDIHQRPAADSNIDHARRYLLEFQRHSRSDDLRYFIDALRRMTAGAFTPRGAQQDIAPVPENDGLGLSSELLPWAHDTIQLHYLLEYIIEHPLLFDPPIAKVASMFSTDILVQYDEIIGLMYIHCSLEAVPPDTLIRLRVEDFIEDLDDAKHLYSEYAFNLVETLRLYSRMYQVLSQREDYVRERFTKAQARDIVGRLGAATSTGEKGKLLEELMALIFDSDPGLTIVEMRYSTGDEEIDLLVKNNVPSPFWTSILSPMLFVECKNWRTPVGSKELRDFEIKLQNHRPLVRLGFFVAAGGFSSECATEIRRASREEYLILMITLDDVLRFIANTGNVLAWLEEIICRPI
jgi:hypothetical protein